jgi:hypothetical protein
MPAARGRMPARGPMRLPASHRPRGVGRAALPAGGLGGRFGPHPLAGGGSPCYEVAGAEWQLDCDSGRQSVAGVWGRQPVDNLHKTTKSQIGSKQVNGQRYPTCRGGAVSRATRNSQPTTHPKPKAGCLAMSCEYQNSNSRTRALKVHCAYKTTSQ